MNATKRKESNKSTGSNCLICCEIWRKGVNAIKCKTCEHLAHGPGKNKRCSLLSTEEYVYYTDPNNINSNWLCPKRMLMQSSFNIIDNNDLSFVNSEITSESVNIRVCPDGNMLSFLNECNQILLEELAPDSKEEYDSHNNISSRYYDNYEFHTKTEHDLNSSLRVCHTNIASISKHIDDLRIALSMLKTNFHIIGIIEHKSQNHMDPIRKFRRDFEQNLARNVKTKPKLFRKYTNSRLKTKQRIPSLIRPEVTLLLPKKNQKL